MGDDGERAVGDSNCGRNIGLGLLILPSDPLRWRCGGIPYPVSAAEVLTGKSSPNKGRLDVFKGGGMSAWSGATGGSSGTMPYDPSEDRLRLVGSGF